MLQVHSHMPTETTEMPSRVIIMFQLRWLYVSFVRLFTFPISKMMIRKEFKILCQHSLGDGSWGKPGTILAIRVYGTRLNVGTPGYCSKVLNIIWRWMKCDDHYREWRLDMILMDEFVAPVNTVYPRLLAYRAWGKPDSWAIPDNIRDRSFNAIRGQSWRLAVVFWIMYELKSPSAPAKFI
jgi:hypothetical protein